MSWTHLSAEKFFLWSYVKDKICKTQPACTPDVKQAFRYHSEAFPQDLMQCVIASLPGRMQEWRGGDGSHMKNVTFKC